MCVNFKAIIALLSLAIILGLSYSTRILQNMTSEKVTELSILDSIDRCDETHFFLDLEHGYFYTSGSRLTLFADSTRWAIVSEKSGFHNRKNVSEIEMVYHGNCLANLPKDEEGNEYNFINHTLIGKSNIDSIKEAIREHRQSVSVLLRDHDVPINLSTKEYIDKQIIKMRTTSLKIQDVVRLLNETNKELFYATESELRNCLPDDLPLIFTITNWHHKNYYYNGITVDGQRPSSYETFNLISKIIVTKDTSLWMPKLPQTNDWRSHPRAGEL